MRQEIDIETDFFFLSKHGLLMVSVFHGLGVMHTTPCISLPLHFRVV